MRFVCPPFLILTALLPLAAQEVELSAPSEQLLNAATVPEARYNLLLLGGGLAHCSSVEQSQCSAEVRFDDTAKQHNLYQITPTQLQLLGNAKLFSAERAEIQSQVLTFLATLAQQHPTPLSAQALTELWRTTAATEQQPLSGEALWQQLSERELAAIFDYLELPVLSSDGKYRLTEQVNIQQFKDPVSHALYLEIVSLAQQIAQQKGRSQANIYVVTAALRDPFAPVDMLVDLFTQAGAKAQWLPLSASLQAAQASGQCQSLAALTVSHHGSYRREQIYPDLLAQQQAWCKRGRAASEQAIAEADAIFFYGNDATLAYQALRQPDGSASIELDAIFTAFNTQQLLIAANSATATAMSGNQFFAADKPSIPMLSNGDSYHALQYGAKAQSAPALGCRKENACPVGLSERQLTYIGAGGLGLFPLGIIDSHFAQRGRQARLLVLQQATQSPYAFGIDENTALLVDLNHWQQQAQAQLKVLGAGEVFISELSAQESPGQYHALTTALSHNDKLLWPMPAEGWLKNDEKALVTTQPEPLQSKSPVFSRQHFQQLSRSLCRSNFSSASISEPPYQIKLSKISCYQDADGRLSYRQQLRIISPD